MDHVQSQTLLQQMAENWMLLAMFALFIGCWVWAFLPGLRAAREDASQIPFRNEQLTGDQDDHGRLAAQDSVTEPKHG